MHHKIVVICMLVVAIATTVVQSGNHGEQDEAVVALGRRLFYDPVLSVDQTTSCGTCHQQFAAFAHVDHALSHGVYGRIGTRNVPALQNLASRRGFMWDGAIEHLDMQALSPLTSHAEMGETLPRILEKLDSVGWCRTLMTQAYGSPDITIPRVLRALGRFVATLESRSSRFDRWHAGQDTLAENERRGYDLFRAYCASCHNGTDFTDDSFRSNGLPLDSLLMDHGRERVTLDEQDRYRFKVPSLRNVGRTMPYMHDGRFKRLRDVLAHYAQQDDLADHADPLVRSIAPLDDRARKDLIAFLLTLTDEAFLRDTAFGEKEVWE